MEILLAILLIAVCIKFKNMFGLVARFFSGIIMYIGTAVGMILSFVISIFGDLVENPELQKKKTINDKFDSLFPEFLEDNNKTTGK